MANPKSKQQAKKIQGWMQVAQAALSSFTALPDDAEDDGPDDFDDEAIEVEAVVKDIAKSRKAALKYRGEPSPLPEGFGGEVNEEVAKQQISSEALFATFVLMWAGFSKDEAESVAMDGALAWHGLEEGE